MQKLEEIYRSLYDGDQLDRKPVFDNGKNGAETQ